VTERIVVLVPVKAFDRAKLRLAHALEPHKRARLAREMASTVVAAATPLPVVVVCDDDGVATWAEACGADVVRVEQPGLNTAVEHAVAELAERGVDRVIIAHSDLPLATELAWVADHPGVTIVPDLRGEGTNVMSLPASVGFRFAYGEGSFDRHLAEAERLDLEVRIARDTRLGWDVDHPADLDLPDIQ